MASPRYAGLQGNIISESEFWSKVFDELNIPEVNSIEYYKRDEVILALRDGGAYKVKKQELFFMYHRFYVYNEFFVDHVVKRLKWGLMVKCKLGFQK